MKKIVDADKKFQTKVCTLRKQSDKITRELRAEAAKNAGNQTNPMMKMMKMGGPESSMQEKQVKLATQYTEAEVQYIKAISKELPKGTREDFTKLLKETQIGLHGRGESAFLTLEEPPQSRPHVWVLKFDGDIQAKAGEALRREVTAIIRGANATRNDEVVLKLTSPGGTVTGYGVASAQLIRLKHAGLKLTICVEQVAASGGYMMACTADHLVASPMAVLGSIGVISEQPNVYKRLDKEGIQFLTVTAGEYKRTLTPFKKPTPEDKKKSEEDLGMVWKEFKNFVQEQRPVLDVEKYGTGETWFGNDALKRNLCDEIANSDDVILDKLDQGAEIYSVKYKNPESQLAKLGLESGTKLPDFSAACKLLGRLLLGESLADIVEPQGPSRGPSNRFLAMDPSRTAETTCFLDEQ
jgi:signal peptide peptidase SppA